MLLISSRKKRSKRQAKKRQLDYSKQLVTDIRTLLWIVTIGALVLAVMCVHKGYLGSLPWVSAMVGLPWSAHGIVCSCYLSMAKSDHRRGGITFETARAKLFSVEQTNGAEDEDKDSPAI